MSDLQRAILRAHRAYLVACTVQYVYLLAGGNHYVTDNPHMNAPCIEVIY